MQPVGRPEEARPYVVGLTGGIGSGKSAAAACFAELGAAIVDTDAIAHELSGVGGAAIPAIEAAFGASVISADGSLNRPAMRAMVFSDERIRSTLEGILHPLIRAESLRRLHRAIAPYAILVVPLLIETGVYRQYCDRVLVVDCTEALQISRVMARSGMAETEVRRVIAAQVDRAGRLAAADDLIDNSGDLTQLRDKVAILHSAYLAAAKEAVARRVL